MSHPRLTTEKADPAVANVAIRRPGESADVHDEVAVERALEIRVNGQPFSVVMRTPGADADLAVGFLFAEGLLRGNADLDRAEIVSDDVVNVVFTRGRADAVAAALERARPVAVNAACGVCGRPELESLGRGAGVLAVGWTVAAGVLTGLTSTLSADQPAFARTGGLHAAGLFDRCGLLVDAAEDIGRHNAVDKLVGRALVAARLPLSDRLLLVSGRVSFEIVQKAWTGGLPLIAAVSAPSSLAISTAERAGITLIGFLRGQRFNIYTNPSRITAS
jgi:FdhD protein